MAESKLEFKIDDFSGGLNERDANHKILNNECVQDVQNVAISRRGSLSKRQGTAKHIAAPVVAGKPVTGLFTGLLRPQAFWSLWGQNRYQTATQVQRAVFREADTCILVSGEVDADYADAAAGNVLAAALECPILLTAANAIPNDTMAFIRELGVKTIYVLGGEAAISADVVTELQEDPEGFTVTRIAGVTRIATAIAIADAARVVLAAKIPAETFGNTVYIVGSAAKADAVVAGPAVAGGLGSLCPVLYVGATLDVSVSDAITAYGSTKAVIIGGVARVSADVQTSLGTLLGAGNVTRIAGDTRYHTALNFADYLVAADPNFISAIIVNGSDEHCIDAAIAGILGARNKAAVFYVGQNAIYSYVDVYLNSYIVAGSKVFVFGGPVAVGADVWAKLEAKVVIPDLERYTLAVAGTHLKQWDGAAWVSLKGNLTEGMDMEFYPYKHGIYMVNGKDGYFVLEEDLLYGDIRLREIEPYNPTDEELESMGANAIPKDPKYIAVHYERIWLACVTGDKKRVFMSDIGTAGNDLESPFKMFRPDYFPANNYFDIPCAQGDTLTGFAIYQDRPHIFTKYSIWTVYGTNPAEYQLVRVRGDIGAVSHRSITEAKGLLLFLSMQGPVAFDGNNYYDLYQKIPDTLDTLDKTKVDKSAGVAYRDQYYLAVPVKGGE